MNKYLLIFLGCGVGGVLRYIVSSRTYLILGQGFPYGTLIVNVTGSFLIGFLAIVILERFGEIASLLRFFLLIGVLGGYTTFSAFSIETLLLFESGEIIKVVFNIFLSLIICLIAVFFGAFLGRRF